MLSVVMFLGNESGCLRNLTGTDAKRSNPTSITYMSRFVSLPISFVESAVKHSSVPSGEMSYDSADAVVTGRYRARTLENQNIFWCFPDSTSTAKITGRLPSD